MTCVRFGHGGTGVSKVRLGDMDSGKVFPGVHRWVIVRAHGCTGVLGAAPILLAWDDIVRVR